MLDCPVCGFENPEDAPECGRCRLASGLFEPVRAAVDVPPDDPRYAESLREVLLAVEGEGGAAPAADPSTRASELALLLSPARFPSTRPPGLPAPRARGARLAPLSELPALPALPSGDPEARLRQQIDEYLTVARRQGMDPEPFHERLRHAVAADDRAAFEALHRELFVHLAAALADDFERTLVRRADLSELVPEGEVDTELASARDSLVLGDLAGAQRRLRRVGDTLAGLEEEWTAIRILQLEATLLAETIRELGGDPGPALGPLDEGRRRVQTGARSEAEPILARATLALWHLLRPRLARRLGELTLRAERARGRGAGGEDFDAARRDVARSVKQRNFAAAVLAYRRLREAVERMETTASAPPSAESGSVAISASGADG